MKPKIRIMFDGDPAERYYCGLFPGGWSSIGRVSRRSLAECVKFYLRVLAYDFPGGRDLVSTRSHA